MKTIAAKEKANELHIEYWYLLNDSRIAKQCALIAVDEILNNNCGSRTDEANATNSEIYCDEYFWNDVKSELQSF